MLTCIDLFVSIYNILYNNRKVLYSEIHCISTPVDSTNGGYVQLTIDGSIQYGHFYTYTEDPQYYSVQPQFTIPA